MMSDAEIREALKELCAAPMQVWPGIVKSVNEEAMTATVLRCDDVEFEDVRIRAFNNDDADYLIEIPANNSMVLMTAILNDSGQLAIIKVNKPIKWKGKIGVMEFTMIDDDGFTFLNDGTEVFKVSVEGTCQFNDGSNGGMLILQKVLENLNSLKSYCETLTSAVSSGLNAVGAGTGASGSAGAAQFEADMLTASISFEDMENENVKH